MSHIGRRVRISHAVDNWGGFSGTITEIMRSRDLPVVVSLEETDRVVCFEWSELSFYPLDDEVYVSEQMRHAVADLLRAERI